MNNMLAIMRRDLGAYFTSPIGYIFMMVFVTVSVGLYMSSFFIFPTADMRPFFQNLPLIFCVFMPAITMRIWAEERKENTWEMLLTFPMKAWELVLGKFAAALIFFALALAATCTVPLMLSALGEPDVNVMLTGYLGTLLLGAFFLALGIMISGFFKDQIIAFVVTLLACLLLFLVGTSFIAGQIDDRLPGVGTAMRTMLGFADHYNEFTRGVLDIADLAFFVVWSTGFLYLNIIFVDGRNRPGASTVFAIAVVLAISIGGAVNYLTASANPVTRALRFDVTEGQIYTVSQASKNILELVDAPVTVTLYITPQAEMPTELKDLERDITDKLQELSIASNGEVDFTTFYLNVANVLADPADPLGTSADADAEDDDEAIESRMLDKGVQPFSVQAIKGDEVTSKLIYSSIGIGYKDQAEEILPQILPQNLQELEYRLVSTIYKLTREDKPIVALVAPTESFNIDPQMRQMLMQMGQPVPEQDDPYEYLERVLVAEKYEVQRVEMTKASPLPDDYDTLVIVNPRSLNERQRYEIGRALHSGKDVVMAVQTYQWDYRPSPDGFNVSRQDETPEINPLLDAYGLGVSTDVLMDVNQLPLRISSGTVQDLFGGGRTVSWPMHVLVTNENMDKDVSITSRLSNIFYLWGTALDLDEDRLDELGLETSVVMQSSEQAWAVDVPSSLSNADLVQPAETQQYPLMAIVAGQFPDPFEGEERPDWPPPPPQQPGMPPPPPDTTPDPPDDPVEAAPAQLILMGCSQMFRKEFLQAGNLDMFMNCVDAVTLDENIVNVRGRKPIDRRITPPDDSTKTMWRLANFGLSNTIIAIAGIALYAYRRQSRNAYTVAQQIAASKR